MKKTMRDPQWLENSSIKNSLCEAVDLLAAGPVADDDLHLESAQEGGVPDFETVGAVFDLNQKSFLFS